MSEEVKRPNRKLGVHEMQLAEYQRNDWIANPETGTTIQEMLDPIYWASNANRMKRWDRIEVRPADGTWWAELLVRAVEPFAVKVELIRAHRFDAKAAAPAAMPEVPDGYEVKHRGNSGWTVRRTSDGSVLAKDLKTEAEARIWLDSHLRRLAA